MHKIGTGSSSVSLGTTKHKIALDRMKDGVKYSDKMGTVDITYCDRLLDEEKNKIERKWKKKGGRFEWKDMVKVNLYRLTAEGRWYGEGDAKEIPGEDRDGWTDENYKRMEEIEKLINEKRPIPPLIVRRMGGDRYRIESGREIPEAARNAGMFTIGAVSFSYSTAPPTKHLTSHTDKRVKESADILMNRRPDMPLLERLDRLYFRIDRLGYNAILLQKTGDILMTPSATGKDHPYVSTENAEKKTGLSEFEKKVMDLALRIKANL